MKEIDDINTDIEDGKLLLAAIAKITTESQTDKTPDEVLGQLNILSKQMFKEEIKGTWEQMKPKNMHVHNHEYNL